MKKCIYLKESTTLKPLTAGDLAKEFGQIPPVKDGKLSKLFILIKNIY